MWMSWNMIKDWSNGLKRCGKRFSNSLDTLHLIEKEGSMVDCEWAVNFFG